MLSREQKILSCIDPDNQIGIEIGALNRPIVTREMGKIRYVDHATTEELRSKYAIDPNVDVDQIVDVNYVWGAQTLPELVGDEAPFDYVIASHVIEHVPDFIGWLKEIQAVLKPGGILSLAIPDKRFCFDYFRYPTKAADVIEAYLYHSRKPSPRQIFDHFASAVTRQGIHVWSGAVAEQDLTPIHTITEAWQVSSHAFAEGHYCDAHCWVFTPRSFRQLLHTLIELDLFGFEVTEFYPTDGCEFYVSLTALSRTDDLETRKQLQLESLSQIDQSLDDRETTHQQLQAEVIDLKHHLEQTQERLQKVQAKLDHRVDRVQHLQTQIKKLKAERDMYQGEVIAIKNSRLWRFKQRWFKLKQVFKR